MKECPTCSLCFDDEYNRCPHDNQTLLISNNCGVTIDNRYILERRLGKGGMGSVFKGKHIRLRSTHAIKIISPELVNSDSSLLIRFNQEAVLAASIHHPNVISVTDFGVENDITPYLVMEYIEGISLDELLRREKRLAPLKAFEIFKPIALGISAAHGKGITHRDIKPLNVMLRKGYPPAQAVKVLDFGLAKIKASETMSSLIMAKTMNLLGSPHYMPPEQWDNENVDNRSDIYSLGVILFQMLTGDVPFKGDSIPNVMFQHLQAAVPSFESIGIPAAPRIEAVIEKALAKEQDQRYQTVEEFLSEYEKAVFSKGDEIEASTNAKTVSFSEENFAGFKADSTQQLNRTTGEGLGKTYNLPFLNSDQNKTITDYFTKSRLFETEKSEKLEEQFLHAQNRVEEARERVSEAEKLAFEFNEAQKAAESARLKFVQAQQKLEEDVRRQLQREMESKLVAEIEARKKAEAEAQRLVEEARARKEAEQRANQLAKAALEAQQRAEAEQRKAEQEIRQRQHEEGSRRKAEGAALQLAVEVAEAKKKYEQARKEAEAEAGLRAEAESKLGQIEEEIRRIADSEAEKRRAAEAEAARKIKEQASRLEQQAIEAEKKAEQARLLAESEAQKREQAETARKKAEEEARRLAEEIIQAQKRLEEAEQRAKSETEKRVQEEAARKRAEASARSLSESLEEAENYNKNQQTLVLEGEGFKNSSRIVIGRTEPSFETLPAAKRLADTSLTEISNTNQVSRRKAFNPAFLLSGLIVFLLIGGISGFLIYYNLAPNLSKTDNSKNVSEPKNSPEPTPELSERIKNKMVKIEGGEFLMGRNDVDPKDERIYSSQFPAHPITVETFYLDRTEVTNEEYAEFVQAKEHKPPDNWTNGKPPAGEEQFPVTMISYFDARNFADWISARDRVPCRLPTEQEWEYAARSGARQNIYPWGNEWVADRVNFASGTLQEAGATGDETAVGGVKEMMGNVLEWTSSTFQYYPGFPENIKENENVSGKITVRGVSYTKKFNAAETLQKKELLLTLRQGVSPDRKYDFLGFRLTCSSK